ncbi:hypothetical protein ACHAXS_013779 [Conticribra weissflogii]
MSQTRLPLNLHFRLIPGKYLASKLIASMGALGTLRRRWHKLRRIQISCAAGLAIANFLIPELHTYLQRYGFLHRQCVCLVFGQRKN